MENIIEWLLEDCNPEVRYRTMLELQGLDKNDQKMVTARNLLLQSSTYEKVMKIISSGKKWDVYSALSAIAEFGLTREDVAIDQYAEKLLEEANLMCGEALLLRNLVLLGYENYPKVKEQIAKVLARQKPDGGYGCMSKQPKINLDKGCYRQTNTVILLVAALRLRQKNFDISQADKLIDYYRKRDVLYTHDDPQAFVVPDLASTYYPLDPVKIGLQMTMYSLSVLGVASESCCKRAWEILEEKRETDGRYILDNSLSKPLYKIGKVGTANKWVTLYALLAEKYRGVEC